MRAKLTRLVQLVLAAMVLLPSQALGTPARSAVYCLHDRNGLKIFAAKEIANRDLKFGLSIWSKAKNNIGAFGTAHRRGDG
jgi:hypothetical protein